MNPAGGAPPATASGDLQSVLEAAARTFARFFSADAVIAVVRDGDADAGGWRPLLIRSPRPLPPARTQGSWLTTLATSAPRALADLDRTGPADLRLVARELGMHAALLLPLECAGERVGGLALLAATPGVYDAARLDLAAELAGVVAVAVQQALASEAAQRVHEKLLSERDYLLEVDDDDASIVGASPALRSVLEQVRLVAATETSVLLTGESGTGKELIARAIHLASSRRDRVLVRVNCAAIPGGLVESELFGHEQGAFTGASKRRKGRFEVADGATLFLDEVGELPLDVQAKLLRVLQEREFERVGGNETLRVDVRLVSATNRDLRAMVAQGRFREDLYYRLNVFPIALPPLRERIEDAPLLAQVFMRRVARRAGKRLRGFTPGAIERLLGYAWPGNVRELQNVVERAVVLCTGEDITADVLLLPEAPAATGPGRAAKPAPAAPTPEPRRLPNREAAAAAPPAAPSPPSRHPGSLPEGERERVLEVLTETRWVIDGDRGAAARLGLHPNTLRSRIKRWGLVRPPG